MLSFRLAWARLGVPIATWLLAGLLMHDIAASAQQPDASHEQPRAVTRFNRPIMVPDPARRQTRVFNPSVIVRGDQLAMLYRVNVEDSRASQIWLAFSSDGRTFIPYKQNPVLSSRWGAEDPRVVRIHHLYYMTYVCNREDGPQQQCMATSKDLIHWTDKGVILEPQHAWDHEQVKAAVIVPHKVAGSYVMYFAGQTTPWHTSLGMAVSSDLLHWKELTPQPVLEARSTCFDSLGVEPGATPLLLRAGILLVYNGWNPEHVHKTGWVMFSRKDPAKVIARADVPFIEPHFPYEIEGHNAFTFTEGAVRFHHKWWFYYGAADRSIGLAQVDDLGALLRTTQSRGDATGSYASCRADTP